MEDQKQTRYYNFMATITYDVANTKKWLCAKDIFSFIAPHFDLDNDKIAVMLHDKDIGSVHYHIAIHLKDAKTITSIAKKLDIPPNFVEKWDSRVDNLFAYLLHITDNARAEKYNYADYIEDDIHLVTNMDRALFKAYTVLPVKTKRNSGKLDDIQKKILTGEITERDLLAPEMIIYYAENANKVKKCLELRQKSLKLNPPKCSVIYISGGSGLGKTTLATNTAKEIYGNSYCMASSPNDPLQDYTDEKCFIIDDFRARDYDFALLLGLLDPNYRSRTHKSRYYNKVLACEMVILTSVDSIDDTLSYYEDTTNEDMKQLRRRVQTVYEMKTNSTFKHLTYSTMIYEDTTDTYQYLEDQQTLFT